MFLKTNSYAFYTFLGRTKITIEILSRRYILVYTIRPSSKCEVPYNNGSTMKSDQYTVLDYRMLGVLLRGT